LCTSIGAASVEEMSKKAERALELGSELLEFRIDYIKTPRSDEILEGLERYADRAVFTLRGKSQRGLFEGTEEGRVNLMLELCAMRPAYVDIELQSATPALVSKLARGARTVIVSWHDFRGTPMSSMLAKKYREARELGIAKIVTLARKRDDNLRVLSLYGERGNKDLIAFCMGEKGAISRFFSIYAGSPICYAALPGERMAPGQLSIVDMKELVRILG
jgi:3-dehydroquinate dehydratase-1